MEATVDKVGAALTAAAIVGVATHAGLTAVKGHGQDKNISNDNDNV